MAAKITQIHLHNSSNAERLIFFKQHFIVSHMQIEKLISLNLDKSFFNKKLISPESRGKYNENYY